MFKYLLIAGVMILLSPTVISKEALFKSSFIVWNVGQGQWTTLVDSQFCYHFDMGGERSPLSQVKRVCAEKENRIYLSHWDWDHISFALKAQKILKKACLAIPPLGKSSAYKMRILKAYKKCDLPSTADISLQELTHFTPEDLGKKTNDLSHVLVAEKSILIPGDSTSQQEKIWSYEKGLLQTRLLVLGHHGSKTSTSDELLSHLPRLKIAVASARQARYGHPHFEVLERLKKYRVPVLRTEDWGNIWFQEKD
jgi:competence protein ComEC